MRGCKVFDGLYFGVRCIAWQGRFSIRCSIFRFSISLRGLIFVYPDKMSKLMLQNL